MATDPCKLGNKESAGTIDRGLESVSNSLMKGIEDIDLGSTLSTVGVDSLRTIEIGNWWRQNLELDV